MCVCVGSMRESVRGAEEKTHKNPPTEHRGNSSRIAGLARRKKNKKKQQRDQECMQTRPSDSHQTGEKTQQK